MVILQGKNSFPAFCVSKDKLFQTYRSCNSKAVGEGELTCYLCKGRVSVTQWRSGDHRRKCAADHRQFLDRLPTPAKASLTCPKCRKRLKLWPDNHGPPFACCSSKCPVVGRIRSNGHNRFSCFTCAFDLCESCVNRKMGRVSWIEDGEERRAPEGAVGAAGCRDSWYVGVAPSAPVMEEEEGEPPPSYQEAVYNEKPVSCFYSR